MKVSALRRILPTARSILLEKSLSALKFSDCTRVLVVGSGLDPWAHLFDRAEIYVRCDVRPWGGTTDVVADAHRLPFPNGVFDCVFAIEVIEHLDSPKEFGREAVRVLRPGGRAIATVPFLFHIHSDPDDFWRPTPSSCAGLFVGCEVDVQRQGNRIHVISDLLTTAWAPVPILAPLRALNHFLRLLPTESRSTAPSGFCIVATLGE